MQAAEFNQAAIPQCLDCRCKNQWRDFHIQNINPLWGFLSPIDAAEVFGFFPLPPQMQQQQQKMFPQTHLQSDPGSTNMLKALLEVRMQD